MEQSSIGNSMSNNENLKKQLEAIQNQLNQMRKEMLEAKIEIIKAQMVTLEGQMSNNRNFLGQLKNSAMESKSSDFNLYWSIYVSALVGVFGNWFVTLMFQPSTESTFQGLITSGFFLVLTFAFLVIQMTKSLRRIKATTNIP